MKRLLSRHSPDGAGDHNTRIAVGARERSARRRRASLPNVPGAIMHREVAPIVADGSVYITGPHSAYCARCSHRPRDPTT